MATSIKSVDDLSQDDRSRILMALDNQIAVFNRKMKAEPNSDIRALVEKDLIAVQNLSTKFRFVG